MNKPKFRAWWAKEKEMHEVTAIDFLREEVLFFAADSVYLKDVILMQYTGLKDKNGVEIYGGSCIEGKYPNGRKFKGIVEYSTDQAGYIVKTTYSWKPSSLDMCRDCTVIGSIHENPELLKN